MFAGVNAGSAINSTNLKHFAFAASLGRCPMFAGLPRRALEQIASIAEMRNLEKGEYLFLEGHPSEGFYVIQHGVISLHLLNSAGKLQIIRICSDGDSFGETTLTDDAGHHASARALTDATIFVVPRKRFMAQLRNDPEIAVRTISALSRELREVVSLVHDVTLKTVEERCIHWLLKHRPAPDGSQPYEIQLNYSKRLLAAKLNVTCETLSRTLGKLRNEQLIQLSGKKIFVPVPRQLEQRLARRSL